MTGEAPRSGSLSFGRIARSAKKLKQRHLSRHHVVLLSLLLVLPLSLAGTRAFTLLDLTQELPAISESVTINDPPPRAGGGSFIQIVGHTGGDYRIFTITTSGTVTLHTLALRNGNVTG